jgi:hypothetical protein
MNDETRTRQLAHNSASSNLLVFCVNCFVFFLPSFLLSLFVAEETWQENKAYPFRELRQLHARVNAGLSEVIRHVESLDFSRAIKVVRRSVQQAQRYGYSDAFSRSVFLYSCCCFTCLLFCSFCGLSDVVGVNWTVLPGHSVVCSSPWLSLVLFGFAFSTFTHVLTTPTLGTHQSH